MMVKSDVRGSTSGGKQVFNKKHELTTTQLIMGAVVLYLLF